VSQVPNFAIKKENITGAVGFWALRSPKHCRRRNFKAQAGKKAMEAYIDSKFNIKIPYPRQFFWLTLNHQTGINFLSHGTHRPKDSIMKPSPKSKKE
jgi:hypothetical protein